MLTLVCKVKNERHFAGVIIFEVRGSQYEFYVSAQSDPKLSIPDPAAGIYRMVKIVDVPDSIDAIAAYGTKVIFFESDYEDGKPVLALHGGDPDEDGRLLATEGGLRLFNKDLEELVRLIKKDEKDVVLIIREGGNPFEGKLFQRTLSCNRAPSAMIEEQPGSYVDALTILRLA